MENPKNEMADLGVPLFQENLKSVCIYIYICIYSITTSDLIWRHKI